MIWTACLLLIFHLAADEPKAKPEPPMPPEEEAVVVRPEPPMPPDEAEFIAREEAAKKKRLEAEAAAAKALAEQRKVRRQQVASMRSNGWVMPVKPPTAARRERFLFLLPSGPIIAEISMTIDAQPYWTYREKMIEKLLAGDPKVDGGRVSWLAILKNPRATNGRYTGFPTNETFFQQQAQQFDLDGDGFSDREEVQNFLAQSFGGPALMVVNYPVQQLKIPVFPVLDTNRDGKLAAAELEASPSRLASRDADDNELLEPSEIGGIHSFQMAYQADNYVRQLSQLVMAIDDGFDRPTALRILATRYGKDGKLALESLARTSPLVASLDANGDSELQAEELASLERCPPHVVLEVNLGQTGNLPPGMVVRQVSPELKAKPAASTGEKVALEMPAMNVQLVGASPQLAYDYNAQVQSVMTTADTDKNGYIEKKELVGQLQGYLQQFVQWDANDDGKVYPDELRDFFERYPLPMLNTVSIGGTQLGNSLWDALDQNADGQLNLRERAEAPARLKKLDINADGQVDESEILPTLRFVVARGQYAYQYLTTQQFAYRPPTQAGKAPPGPTWFHRMDRNSDGDVSRREFLGGEEQFRALDANGDGILDLQEAEKGK